MPKFIMIPMEKLKAQSGLRSATLVKLKPYLEAIKKLNAKTGCQMVLRKGENSLSVRNNLNKAATIAGRKIKISKSGDTLSVHLTERRGRKPKASQTSAKASTTGKKRGRPKGRVRKRATAKKA